MVLVWRVLGAVAFVVGSEGAAIWFCAVPVGAMADADVAPFCLAGAARDLAHRCSPMLAANTAGLCVGASSWHRPLLWL